MLSSNRLVWFNPKFPLIIIILLFLLVASADGAELPAFPGAEGFGAVAVGGRGGKVIKVTNLNSSGPGSLQAAAVRLQED